LGVTKASSSDSRTPFFPGFFILAVLLNLLGSCQGFNKEPALLWTDRAEIAAYAEIFNTSQNEHMISVVYRETPALAVRQAEIPPDIVIGSYLNDRRTIPLFQSLDSMIKDEQLKQNEFYPGLLQLGVFEEKQTLIPVSFSLPLMTFLASYEEIESFDLSLQQIREHADGFPDLHPSRTVLGYSPRWNQEAAFTYLQLFNINFRETMEGTLIWNQEALEQGIAYMREWIEEVNGGWDTDIEFIEKYMYEPPYKLVNSGRILFAFFHIDTYFSIPSADRERLDFRWISHENQIPIRENIVFAGIPRAARKSKAAKAFLEWFFRPENQALLLETSQYKRMRHFGIAGGFSSLQGVNEIELPRYFPELVGHIPPASFVEFSPALPDIWNDLKSDSILPWIRSQLKEVPAPQELRQSIERWMNQQPQR
jgi:ABC-type glycerol-3-phosphate transport system substrate-binding protein